MAALMDMHQQVGWPLEIQADLCYAPPLPPPQECAAHIKEHMNPNLYQILVSHKVPWSIIKHIVDEDWVDLESTVERWPDTHSETTPWPPWT